ncbi:MAG: C40 family peptidase [Bacteroidota bacterium]|nr:C40 family peptidase [Bacteroidota bacterium]
MNGIITLPLVPLRRSNDERSELDSQLLFGESVEIKETKERWLFIRNLTDNYTGWVDRKMVQILPAQEYEQIVSAKKYIVQVPFCSCIKTNSNERMFLPGGSIIPSGSSGKFTIGKEIYSLEFSELLLPGEISGQKLISLARQYLNAPYLWGGKSLMGIDCSGLVQVVFAMCGFFVQRDASQQVDSGYVIDFLSEAKAGDLAFFENQDGRIIHVGILLNSHQIIHASGWVKIETIDSQGIISAQTGEYTHRLRVVKRLI